MWLDQVARPTLRPKTIEGYETVIRRHLLPRIGAKTLRSLTTSDVRVLMAGMTQQGLAPRTVQYVHAVLRTALAQAVRDDLVGRNVASVVRAPRQTRREAAFLTPDEARQLIAAAKGTELEAVVVVALTLGMRRGELLGLRWSAMHLDAGQLRIVPRWRDFDLVFTSDVGTPIDPRNFDREFKELLASAGVPRIRFHDLRHTFATFLLAEGDASPSRHGTTRALPDRHHDEHLRPRPASAVCSQRGSSRDSTRRGSVMERVAIYALDNAQKGQGNLVMGSRTARESTAS